VKPTLAAIFPPTQLPERLNAVAQAADEYARAGATRIAVNAVEDDADLERFAGFLAREVGPLLSV
jgi:hypothetical protein